MPACVCNCVFIFTLGPKAATPSSGCLLHLFFAAPAVPRLVADPLYFDVMVTNSWCLLTGTRSSGCGRCGLLFCRCDDDDDDDGGGGDGGGGGDYFGGDDNDDDGGDDDGSDSGDDDEEALTWALTRGCQALYMHFNHHHRHHQ